MSKDESPVKFYLASQDRASQTTAPGSDPDLQAQFETMTAERDALQARLDAAKLLPDNALELLESIKGIGPDMAKKALDALTSGKPDGGK